MAPRLHSHAHFHRFRLVPHCPRRFYWHPPRDRFALSVVVLGRSSDSKRRIPRLYTYTLTHSHNRPTTHSRTLLRSHSPIHRLTQLPTPPPSRTAARESKSSARYTSSLA